MEDINKYYKFVPVFRSISSPTTQNNTKIIKTMKKKIYTAPALSVEEFELNEVICTSPLQSVENNAGLNYVGSDADYVNSGGGAMGKSRGIWDED